MRCEGDSDEKEGEMLTIFISCIAMSNSELATSYASLILADEGIEITAEKINALVSAAKIDVEPIWATLLAKVHPLSHLTPSRHRLAEQRSNGDIIRGATGFLQSLPDSRRRGGRRASSG